jgi:hypothetical protein
MPAVPETLPVRDSVAKINDELAVGSDLEFQRRWEKMEKIVWAVLTLFLVLSLAGAFGRGPVAKGHVRASNGSFEVEYERIQRFGAPSILTVDFQPAAIHGGTVQLWVSDALVKPLGNQRIVPQPLKSVIGEGGILYTFPATTSPASVEFQTQPSAIGRSELTVRVPGLSEVSTKIFVMP